MNDVAVRLTIRGLVQGVGYRYFCYREALRRGLTGWVKNMPDGSVAAVAEGNRGMVNDLIEELRRGPFGARVTEIETDWQSYTGQHKSFEIQVR